MTRTCCIPNCQSKSSMKNEKKSITTFAFPKDQELRKEWIKAVGIKHWQPRPASAVCINHFHTSDIRRFGKKPNLCALAIPFAMKVEVDSDVIEDYEHFKNKFESICSLKNWKFTENKKGIFVYTLAEDEDGILMTIENSILIDKELNIKSTSKHDSVQFIEDKLNRFSQFDNILQNFTSHEQEDASGNEEEVEESDTIVKQELIITEDEDDCENDDVVAVSDDDLGDPLIVKRLEMDFADPLEFKCRHCNESFNKEVNRYIHEKKGHSNTKAPLICEICQELIPAPMFLRHYNRHLQAQSHECNTCNMEFPTACDLRQHLQIHSGQETYFCATCNLKFNDKAALRDHFWSLHFGTGTSYDCSCCPQKFDAMNSLNEHYIAVHPDYQYKNIPKMIADVLMAPRNQLFRCNICNQNFARNRNLIRHFNVHIDSKIYECDTCGKKYTMRNYFIRHLSSHDKAAVSVPILKPVDDDKLEVKVDKTKFKCQQCGKQLSGYTALRDHRNIHTGDKPYQCSVCSRRFSALSTWKSHEQLHTGVKNFECEFCDMKFARKRNMKLHLRRHTGEKRFQCSICGKKYADATCYRRHTDNHEQSADQQPATSLNEMKKDDSKKERQKRNTGAKNYKCDLCDKMFARKRNVDHHKKYTHTGLKPYECEFCNKQYHDITSFKKHIQRHTELCEKTEPKPPETPNYKVEVLENVELERVGVQDGFTFVVIKNEGII